MTGPRDALSPVNRTALAAAGVRARETERPDALFADPFAAAFVAAGSLPSKTGRPPAAPSPRQRALAQHVIVRTRFYDDFLLQAVREGCRQVVLLAAGLDSRAYRLGWPAGVTLYELDLAAVLSFKDDVLTGTAAMPRCAREVVPVDLRGDWPAALMAAGFDPRRRTAWLAEGLLVYLDARDAANLLTAVTTHTPTGSSLAMEDGRNALAFAAAAADEGDNAGPVTGLWLGGLEDDPVQWLGTHGWRADIHPFADVAARYGRRPVRPVDSAFIVANR